MISPFPRIKIKRFGEQTSTTIRMSIFCKFVFIVGYSKFLICGLTHLKLVHTYLGHIGNVRERHFWPKHPTWVIVSSLADLFVLKILIFGTEPASFMNEKLEYILVLCPEITLENIWIFLWLNSKNSLL